MSHSTAIKILIFLWVSYKYFFRVYMGNIFSKNSNIIFYFLAFVFCVVMFNGKLNLSYPTTANINIEKNDRYGLVSMHKSTLDTMMKREVSTPSVEERKKFRWLYKYFEVGLYETLEFSNIKIEKYLVLLHYSTIIFLSLVLSFKTFQFILINKQLSFVAPVSFISLYAYILLITPMDEYFTFIEVFSIFLAVYSSLAKNKLLFFISILIGVSNRESGLVLGLVYVVLNYENMNSRSIFLYITSPIILFSVINYDILSSFLNTMLYTLDNGSRASLLNYAGLLVMPIGELLNNTLAYVAYLTPLGYLMIKINPCLLLQQIKVLIFIYLIIILFGSFFGNLLLLLLLPFYLILIALYLNGLTRNYP